MVTSNTLLKDLYKGTSLEKYAKYFYYGFTSPDWQNNPLGSFNKGVWLNDLAVESLNYIEELNDKNKLEFIFFDKNKPDVNVCLLKQDKPSKLAILCAGGGYNSVATAIEASYLGEYLHKQGFVVALLTYSILKDANNDKATEDITNAVHYLIKHDEELNIDIENYIVGGFSAGAHLASRLGTNNSGYKVHNLIKPGLIFLAYPVIDFTTHAHLGSRDCLLNLNPTQEEMDKVSTHKHVDKDYPPVFMWQCLRDEIVSISNSRLMAEALKKANVAFEYETFDSNIHGWGFAKGTLADGWTDRMLVFYRKLYK